MNAAPKPLVSIVTPTFNRREQLLGLLESLKQSNYPQSSIEALIVDNAAEPGLTGAIKNAFPNVGVFVPDTNLFSNPARKLAAAKAQGDYIFFLDDDNKLDPDCLAELIDVLEADPEIGMAGPVMLEGDSDTIWCAGAVVTSFGTVTHFHQGKTLANVTLPPLIRDIDFFPNACLIRKEALQQAPLDEVTFPHNWAEVDFGLRVLAAGYKAVCVTNAIERHYVGYSGRLTRFNVRSLYDQAKSRILFRKRHLPKFSHWLKFWVIVFPISTATYLIRIIKTPTYRMRMLSLFVRGTVDGLLASPSKPPNPRKLITKEGRT